MINMLEVNNNCSLFNCLTALNNPVLVVNINQNDKFVREQGQVLDVN